MYKPTLIFDYLVIQATGTGGQREEDEFFLYSFMIKVSSQKKSPNKTPLFFLEITASFTAFIKWQATCES